MRGALTMPVPPKLLNFARQLRRQQTNAEQLIWQLIRNRNLSGYKFRRQHPICGYILDFYCYDVKLAIELDGGGHNHDEQRLYDDERSRRLGREGIRILRLWNHDVLNATEDVLEEIYRQLELKD